MLLVAARTKFAQPKSESYAVKTIASQLTWLVTYIVYAYIVAHSTFIDFYFIAIEPKKVQLLRARYFQNVLQITSNVTMLQRYNKSTTLRGKLKASKHARSYIGQTIQNLWRFTIEYYTSEKQYLWLI